MNKIKNIIFSMIPAVVLFVGAETILRLVDFKYSDVPLEMRSLAENPELTIDQVIRYNNRDGVIRFIRDSRQLWVPRDSPLDRYEVAKSAGVVRVATIGCSCTAGCVGTQESYPSLMETLLNQSKPGRYEVLNGGVGSYSSYQGLKRLKYEVLKYRPDVLTVFFGWNDHWIAGARDAMLKPRNETEVALVSFMENFRVYQGLHYAIDKFLGRGIYKKAEMSQLQLTLRVPPDDYEKNLSDIADLALSRGVKVLLITAPYDFSRWEPASFFPFPKQIVAPLHQTYNHIVRKVATEKGLGLLDLEKIVSEKPAGSVMSEDGRHFNQTGCLFVAQQVIEALRTLGWL